jgi:hypothetical protein
VRQVLGFVESRYNDADCVSVERIRHEIARLNFSDGISPW